MTDVVVISLEPWDDVWRRNQHLVDGLIRTDPELRVLFVEPAADPLHDLSARRRPQFGRATRTIGDTGRLWALRPLKALPRKFDRGADDRLASAVVRGARKLHMHAPVLWINDPGQARLLELTGWPTLYDITDDWLTANRSSEENARLAAGERTLLARAAEVVACSPELVRRKSPERPATLSPITLIRNAVDAAAYAQPTTRPADLPLGRNALYVGTLHADRLDLDLCERTAAALTGHGTLVLVGPNALESAASDRLQRAGVRILGPRTRTEVIAYLQHADVLVVPHVISEFTDSLDPIKLYEYLAVGRPIVATPVAGFRDASDPRIDLAGSDVFSARLQIALRTHQLSTIGSLVPDWSHRISALRVVLKRMNA